YAARVRTARGDRGERDIRVHRHRSSAVARCPDSELARRVLAPAERCPRTIERAREVPADGHAREPNAAIDRDWCGAVIRAIASVAELAVCIRTPAPGLAVDVEPARVECAGGNRAEVVGVVHMDRREPRRKRAVTQLPVLV